MAKTNWQDPKTGEIISPQISGLQEAMGKVEESIGMESVAETSIPLSEVYIADDDRCRIYQAPEGKRNWLLSPTPIIKKNGSIISSDFEIDYGGGAVVFTTSILETDTLTADATYTKKIEGKQLSTEDYTTEDKDKLQNLNVTVQVSEAVNTHNSDEFAHPNIQQELADLTQQSNENATLKANKTQEDWISPTLQNAWVGTLKYRKNEFNDLVFTGYIGGGLKTKETLLFTLIDGYRVTNSERLPTISYTTEQMMPSIIGFEPDGRVMIKFMDTLSNLSMSGVVIPINN